MAVTPAEIAAALGRPVPAQDSPEWAQWSMWINDALLLIEARLGDPALLDQGKLDYVVREAVVAQVRRPDDMTQLDISVDDGRVSRQWRSSTGRVAILDDWWALLAADGAPGGAWTHDTLAGRHRGYTWLTPDWWVPLP